MDGCFWVTTSYSGDPACRGYGSIRRIAVSSDLEVLYDSIEFLRML